MIPEAKKGVVVRALQEAFGVSEFEDIKELTAGLSSALVFRIVVKGRPYLLRVIVSTEAMHNPTRQFACMKAAAEAGLAPRIWYANVDDRVSITDFVEARPFPLGDALTRAPATVRAVHALPPFPKLVNYVESMDGFVKKFRDAKTLPESETEEVFRQYARVSSVYPRHETEDLVSSHNDLKLENVLFDGNRVWLVDWEAAFLNDRYLDLAVVANFVVTKDSDEEIFLGTYFGEAPGEYRRARFYLMRQVVHMAYTAVFFLIGSGGRPVESHPEVPGFRELHDQMWAGEFSLASSEAKLQYARVHMSQFSQNARTRRFEDAMQVVAKRHAST